MNMIPEIIAHVKQNEGGAWITHTLEEHLNETASIAKKFGNEFGCGDWAELAGFWHDLGKSLPEWQKYIRRKTGYDIEAHIETQKGRPNHSTAGAIQSFDRIKYASIARILAYVISGHHAGLPDWYPDKEGGDLINRLFVDNVLNRDEIDRIKKINGINLFLSKDFPQSPPLGIDKGRDRNEVLQLWIRMIFSCLVDADYLDTETFMNPNQASTRGNYPNLEMLKKRFDIYMKKKHDNAKDTKINRYRNSILQICRAKAILDPGFYSLNVPTGGGKTLSAMAFALEHALKHEKRRIIMAIPYTSIIEQTAKVYKYGTDDEKEIKNIINSNDFLFGEDAVLEHHSNIDPDNYSIKSQLATENWDAPIIVTTNVQLFESLYASKPSKCRKLHNIANSVIILDEAQMLPPEYLKPILSILRCLVDYFGVTVVLCTATQPALEGMIGSQGISFNGLENVKAIIDDPEELANTLKRVIVNMPSDINKKSSWKEIAEELVQYNQVICIVNKRNDCRELHSLMPEGTVHLSALMCGEERSEVISRIKSDLKSDNTIRVISTQLVEAGVDIDFPVVYRALAGMDSVAQAAGRCNREGKLNSEGKLGSVVVFNPPKPAPIGLLRKGEDACKTLLRMKGGIELKPDLFHEYFRIFFASVNDFDKPKFANKLVSESGEFKFQFRTFARDFQLIDDKAQIGVIVRYEGERSNSNDLIEELKKKGPNSILLKKLQRFTVSIPERDMQMLMKKGLIGNIDTHGYYVQIHAELYKPGYGLMYETEWDSSLFVC